MSADHPSTPPGSTPGSPSRRRGRLPRRGGNPANDDRWGRPATGGRGLFAVLVVAFALLASACNGLAFGRNSFGRLGDGTTISSSSAVDIAGPPFASLDGGDQHSCGITKKAELFCWGENNSRQLGLGPFAPTTPTPTRVGSAADWTAVSAGGSHSCGIRNFGQLFCWGRNREGQANPGDLPTVSEPTRIGVGNDWIAVSAGQLHTCGIRGFSGRGNLYCWGFDGDGRVGNGPGLSSTISLIGSHTDWVEVSAGVHTCAVRTPPASDRDGSMFCWGRNESGQLGTGGTAGRDAPAAVGLGTSWQSVSTGERHSCALDPDGRVHCWGSNSSGQLGIGFTPSASVPTEVPAPDPFEHVSLGGSHTCAIADTGMLHCWGQNLDGQLGDGTTINRSTVGAPTHPDPVTSVSAGRLHTLITS